MTNRLAGESSPYLLQHKDNPVDWYPWGAEALARARDEDRPIFLSIGYSACHWCHVMEHESFENTEIATMLNQRFVNIKVDREERPDLDQIYMNAVQMMTGRGGWPMSVFLTPDLQPFYGGTYWPPAARMGMPGFDQVIQGVDDAWKNRRDEAVAQAAKLTDHLQGLAAADATGGEVSEELLHAAVAGLERDFDAAHGGFGTAPKFPHSMCLQFLLRVGKRTANDGILQLVRKNLDMMARGGIYDHLAGGFARYSVDERWLVPHFEKMLYDNALLAAAYIDGYLATADDCYANVARETLDYTLRYMTDTEGGFHSTEDADSEGEEGKFYVWTPAEIVEILGAERADRFCYVYDVSEKGNFEGKNILNLPKTIQQCAALKGWDLDELNAELQESRQQLLAVRDRRVRPGKDDKILTSWNALMIDSMARAAGAFDEPKYLAAARSAAEFVFREMTRADRRLLHAWRRGKARFDAYLDDYTYMINALVSLYQADFDERWIDRAVELAETVIHRFADPAKGGFFYTADDHEQLLTRNKDLQDSSIPSGSSMAATALLRLGRLTGRQNYLDSAGEVVATAADWIRRAPVAMGQALLAADMLLQPSREIVILGDADQILPHLRHGYIPDTLIANRRDESAYLSNELDVLFDGKTAQKPGATVYICENFTCQAPITDIETILSAIHR